MMHQETEIGRQAAALDPACRVVVAIPACNEAERIDACLAALACQRDLVGAPLPPGSLAVLVLANNCRDGTDVVARKIGAQTALDLRVLSLSLAPRDSNAGAARKIAMDRAADMLEAAGCRDGVIMTTDADSAVCSTWVHRSLAAIDNGVDAVAGYIEATPAELVRLGPAFLSRGRLEDRYLAQIAELYALCDPLAHDPWPNHRVSSGASLAVRLDAYRAIGGLPAKAVGEDAALTEALVLAGFKVRHALEIMATTSCRFDGRASGGAADTMKLRHADEDAPCDDDMEAAVVVARRALWKGALRQWYAGGGAEPGVWSRRLGGTLHKALRETTPAAPFEVIWHLVSSDCDRLARTAPLRPSALPAQIVRADAILRRLRRRIGQRRFSDSLALVLSAPPQEARNDALADQEL